MTPRRLAALLLVAATLAVPRARADEEKAAEPAAKPAPNLKVVKVAFRGNRKVEDDAIKAVIKTKPGVSANQELLRDDVRAIWKMGFFEDVQVEALHPSILPTAGGPAKPRPPGPRPRTR